MARSVDEIQLEIMTKVAETPVLAAVLTNTSSVSLFALFAYCVAFCINIHEQMFDDHRADIETLLELQKAHRLKWYQTKVLAFQYGYDLIEDTDRFDNGTHSEDEIAESKIIKYCAVNKAASQSRLVIKIATGDDALEPITTPQLEAFSAYMEEIKDAGVDITILNLAPDQLYLSLRILYDPLVLDSSGNSIVSGGKPVEDALTAFMKELPFNGELSLTALVDRLQNVPGVKIPNLDSARSAAIDPESETYGVATEIDIRRTPDAGYFTIVNFDNITYLPYV